MSGWVAGLSGSMIQADDALFRISFAMAEDKKTADEKTYAQVSREFVRHCGDAIGLASVAADITVLLSEDVNYRLRESVQSAGQFMRHAKRKKLTNEDFNKALRWSDVEPIYGYSSSDPLPFVHVKEAEVFCTEDHEINLVLMANSRHAFEHPEFPAVRAQWLAVEGVQKAAPSSAIAKKPNGVSIPSVSEDLMSYYNQVTKAILGNNEEVTKAALSDLRTNSKIAPLLPFFINFVSVGVKKVSHDLNQLTKLLQTVRSLTNNHYLYLGPRPFLRLLVQGVIYCIVEPLAASLNPINDHWALRDFAAHLLAHIVRLWNTPVNQLYNQTLSALRDIFTDLTKPFCSHYGAVVAIMALGVEPVKICIYPNLERYWPHLTTAIQDSSITNVPFKSDAHKVYGALLLASEFLMLDLHQTFQSDTRTGEEPALAQSSPKPPSEGVLQPPPATKVKEEPMDTTGAQGSEMGFSPSKPPVKQEPGRLASPAPEPTPAPRSPTPESHMYTQLYEFFGDALAARLPFVSIPDFYVPAPEQLLRPFDTPEALLTGEELLEAFNVREDEVQSNSMEDDRYSYDDNSLLSDDGEGEAEGGAGNVDLRIKSTVSDPIQGIKLTITKLPRVQAAPEPAKITIKIPKEQAPPPEPAPPPPRSTAEDEGPFERVPYRPPCMVIELNFEGSMPILSHKLKRKHPGGHPFYQVVHKAETHRIGLRMRRTGKASGNRRGAVRRALSRAFSTGSLITII